MFGSEDYYQFLYLYNYHYFKIFIYIFLACDQELMTFFFFHSKIWSGAIKIIYYIKTNSIRLDYLVLKLI